MRAPLTFVQRLLIQHDNRNMERREKNAYVQYWCFVIPLSMLIAASTLFNIKCISSIFRIRHCNQMILFFWHDLLGFSILPFAIRNKKFLWQVIHFKKSWSKELGTAVIVLATSSFKRSTLFATIKYKTWKWWQL